MNTEELLADSKWFDPVSLWVRPNKVSTDRTSTLRWPLRTSLQLGETPTDSYPCPRIGYPDRGTRVSTFPWDPLLVSGRVALAIGSCAVRTSLVKCTTITMYTTRRVQMHKRARTGITNLSGTAWSSNCQCRRLRATPREPSRPPAIVPRLLFGFRHPNRPISPTRVCVAIARRTKRSRRETKTATASSNPSRVSRSLSANKRATVDT